MTSKWKALALRSFALCLRLSRHQRGNTLVLTAIALIPLIAMIGGAIDISRLYLARTRLQHACDAGALAGRKAMTGIIWSNDSRTIALQFFDTNFVPGKYATGAVDATFDVTSTGAVTGSAHVVVPMTMMSAFLVAPKTIAVSCTADLQLPNTDVMFVLDTTLSMNDTNPGDAFSKIAILRTAVSDFYNQLQRVKASGSHIRYGFVPYSSTVNVGTLLKPQWIVNDWTYASRVPDGTTTATTGPAPTRDEWTTKILSGRYSQTSSPGPAEKCLAPANNGYQDLWDVWTSWSPSATAVPRTRSISHTRNGTTYSATLANGVCTITATTFYNYGEKFTITVVDNTGNGQSHTETYYHWIYKPVSYAMAPLKTLAGDGSIVGGSFAAQVENGQGWRTISWTAANACIEERGTRRTDEGTNVPRYDMDIDLIPDPANPATQWRPFLPGLVFGRQSYGYTATSGWVFTGSPPTATRAINPYATIDYISPYWSPDQYGACPTRALKLGEIEASALSTYLASLKPAGFTYHDIGFLWGLRLMSRDGIFGSENKAAENSGTVARNLIFMTDGDTDTRIGAYDAWGLSAVDRRRTPTGVTPTDAQGNALTEARLLELCSAAKNDRNITVWVIAFGTTLTPLLSTCASPGRAYQANNASQLTQTFSEIASQIAQLRLTR